ncbi:MAG: hypothetical protein AAGE52_31420 [Myxococcota bacterium]
MRALLVVLLIAACGGDDEPREPDPEEQPSPNTPLEAVVIDPNAPMPADVLALAGRVPSNSLKTRMVWMNDEPPRVGFALVAYDAQDLALAEAYADGQRDQVRTAIRAAVAECQEDESTDRTCECCLSCLTVARNARFGERNAVLRLMRVRQPAEGPAQKEAEFRWERQGRLVRATIPWIEDHDGDGRMEVKVNTVISPRRFEGCIEAGEHERIFDGETLEVQLHLRRDTLVAGSPSLGHRFSLNVDDRNGDGRRDYVVEEMAWSGFPLPPDVSPDTGEETESADAVRLAFDAGRQAWWLEEYVLFYNPETDRYERQNSE